MINIIAAAAKNNVIGCKGRIPWSIPQDQKRFREITQGGTVIMGRRTYEEIGRPLPDRLNIIVTRSKSFTAEGLYTAASLEDAVKLSDSISKKLGFSGEIFLCGGAGIYKEGMKLAERIYLTELDSEYEGDVYFPPFDKNAFKLLSSERHDELALSFNIYEKVK